MQQWSAEHVAAMVATGVVATLMIVGARRWEHAWAVAAGRGLAVVIAAGFVCEQVTYAVRGEWTAQVNLPLQLSDAVTLASVAALWRPESALLVELVYFWALSASVQAVLTPDLMQSFPDPLFFTYFATHSGAIAAACLLVFGARRAPRPGALWRVYAITVAFAAVAALATVAHRRQLHVPAAQAGGRLAAGLHGALARLHRRGRRGRPGHVRRARGAGAGGRSPAPSCPDVAVRHVGRTARAGGLAHEAPGSIRS